MGGHGVGFRWFHCTIPDRSARYGNVFASLSALATNFVNVGPKFCNSLSFASLNPLSSSPGASPGILELGIRSVLLSVRCRSLQVVNLTYTSDFLHIPNGPGRAPVAAGSTTGSVPGTPAVAGSLFRLVASFPSKKLQPQREVSIAALNLIRFLFGRDNKPG